MTSMQSKIAKEQNKPGLGASLQKLQDEKAARQPRAGRVRLVAWTGSNEAAAAIGLLPGTATVFWADAKRQALSALERALSSGDTTALRKLHGDLFGGAEKRPVLSVAKAAEVIMREKVLVDLRCGKATIAEFLCLAGHRCGSMLFPYDGALLDERDFSTIEWCKTSSSEPMDVLIVTWSPARTATELEAAKAVPAGFPELHLCGPAVAAASTRAVTVVVVVAANTFAARCSLDLQERMGKIGATGKSFVSGSAGSLVRKRLELLRKSGLA